MTTSAPDASSTPPSDAGPATPSGSVAVATNPSGERAEPALGPPAYAAIHPGIGIARVGNSPTEFFVGPEVPGRPAGPDGAEARYKDRAGRLKRQAARFRIYGYDEAGRVVGELTSALAEITWAVHLTNAKGAWYEFHGAVAEASGSHRRPRNADRGGDPADRTSRSELVIDPGERRVSGPNVSRGPAFDTGSFLGRPVPLGELRTDDAGRLLVLGGFGTSASTEDRPVRDYANNDTWCDDTSDGPVSARVVLHDGTELPVRATSWVVVAPPDFAPTVGNLVTLHDVATEVARTAGWVEAPATVSFRRDVAPVLARIVGYRSVQDAARRGHGAGAAGDFLDPERLRRLASTASADRPVRKRVFDRVRNPNLRGDDAANQANASFMPVLSGDGGFTTTSEPDTWFSVLPGQYELLRRWAEGEFDDDLVDDAAGPPTTVLALPLDEQPEALDRAALEACAGGPFFPGIEMTFTSRDPALWVGPGRLRPELAPGEVTQRMAVPWQADFYECRSRWWPAQRPDEVVTRAEYDAVLSSLVEAEGGAGPRPPVRGLQLSTESWARGLGEDPVAPAAAGDNDMVRDWWRLGVLRERALPDGSPVTVEEERSAYFGMKDREYFHLMLNIESYPDFIPTARSLVERFLAHARAVQSATGCPPDLRPFAYSVRTLRSRLEQVYTGLARDADAFDPSASSMTREDLLDFTVQMAPFNQIDGAWLRNIGRVGPTDEVHALLFNVWADELGNGQPELNHANVYTDLLHNLGVYLEPVTSRAYVENPTLLDSAFTNPLFQLVISQFSEDYFPELLGMTLWLEWGVLSVKPQVAAMESLGVDPLFYRLHIGIDNAVTGHGAMARRAIEIYLDDVRSTSGDQIMQQTWSRIWDGYVAFGTTGSLGEEMRRRAGRAPSPARRVREIIQAKAHVGSQNHGSARLGVNSINSWFDEPAGFMDALVESGHIVPGDVENSPFFDLMRPTGPMFRVFTDDEVRAWETWTRSLAGAGTTAPPAGDTATRMMALVTAMRGRQQGIAGHVGTELIGRTPSGEARTSTVAAWFDGDPVAFLAALADPANGWIVPGVPGESRFVTELASGDHPMAHAMNQVAPGAAHRTWRAIAIEWIEQGAPLPEPPAAPASPVAAVAAAEAPIPRLGLFQNGTWTDELREVPVLGSGSLH